MASATQSALEFAIKLKDDQFLQALTGLNRRFGDSVQTMADEAAGSARQISQAMGKIEGFRSLQEQVKQTQAQWIAARQEVNGLKQAMKGVESPSRKMTTALKKAEARSDRLQQSLDRQRQALNDTKGELKSAGVSVDKLASEQGRLGAALDTANDELKHQNNLVTLGVRPVRDIRSAIQNLEKAYDQLRASGKLSTSELKRAKAALREETGKLTREMRGLDRAFDGLGQRGHSILGVLGGVGAAFGAIGAVELGQRVFETGITFDSLQKKMDAATGSAEQGRKEMAFIEQVAGDMGLRIRDAADQYASLAAATRGTRSEGEPTRKVFQGIAAAAGALKLSADDTAGAINAVQQMFSKGKVQAEELRGQLGERLPGAFKMAAQAMGVSEVQLNKMLERGEVMADQLLPRLSWMLEERFGKAARNSANEGQGALNQFQNAMDQTAQAIAQSGFLTGVTDGMQAFSQQLQDPETRAALAELGQGVGQLIRFAGEHAKEIATLTAVVAGLGGALVVARTAMAGFNTVMALSPIGRVALAVGGLAAAFGLMGDESEQSGDQAVDASRKIVDAAGQTTAASQAMSAAAQAQAATVVSSQQSAKAAIDATNKALNEGLKQVGERITALNAAITERQANLDTAAQAEQAAWQRITTDVEAAYTKQKELMDGQHAQRLQQIADTELSETESRAQTTAAIVEDLTTRSEAILTHSDTIVEMISGAYRAQRHAARQTEEEVRELAVQEMMAKRDVYSRIADHHRGTIDQLIQEEQRHLDEVRDIQAARQQLHMTTEERIRALRRETMSSSQLRADRQLEIDQLQAQARAALRAGDHQQAVDFAKRAQELASQTSDAVTETVRREVRVKRANYDELEAQVRAQNGRIVSYHAQSGQVIIEYDKQVISKKQAVANAIGEVRESAAIADAAMKAQSKSHIDVYKQLRASQNAASNSLTQVTGQVKQLDAALSKQHKLVITASTAEIPHALAEIDRLLAEKDAAIRIKGDLEDVKQRLDDLDERLKVGGGITITATDKEARKTLSELDRTIRNLDPKATAHLDTREANTAVRDLRDRIEDLNTILTSSRHTIHDNMSEILGHLRELDNSHTDSIHTIHVYKKKHYSTGGEVWPDPVRFNTGGVVQSIRNGWQVPGVGDRDSVPAKLPVGAYVLRKAAVQRYGRGPLLETLRNAASISSVHHAVDALLTPGEITAPPSAVQRLGLGFFEALNNLELPALASGGLVPDLGSVLAPMDRFDRQPAQSNRQESAPRRIEVTFNLPTGDQPIGEFTEAHADAFVRFLEDQKRRS
ncbi:MAG: tape measure protein [Magnetococcales bacterium]|nr:tape measure protein [Magnetococcales bacterium]